MVNLGLDIVYHLFKDRENICEINSYPHSDNILDIFTVSSQGINIWS